MEEDIRQTLFDGENKNNEIFSDPINRHWEENAEFIDIAEVSQNEQNNDSGGFSLLELLQSKVRALVQLEREMNELSQSINEIKIEKNELYT